jgi:hypothetical protein
MLYWFKYFDSQEQSVRTLQIEAPNDDAAIDIGARHCMQSGMAIEISGPNRPLIRITPLTAPLYLS